LTAFRIHVKRGPSAPADAEGMYWMLK
jgi:hypothetical protein